MSFFDFSGMICCDMVHVVPYHTPIVGTIYHPYTYCWYYLSSITATSQYYAVLSSTSILSPSSDSIQEEVLQNLMMKMTEVQQ